MEKLIKNTMIAMVAVITFNLFLASAQAQAERAPDGRQPATTIAECGEHARTFCESSAEERRGLCIAQAMYDCTANLRSLPACTRANRCTRIADATARAPSTHSDYGAANLAFASGAPVCITRCTCTVEGIAPLSYCSAPAPAAPAVRERTPEVPAARTSEAAPPTVVPIAPPLPPSMAIAPTGAGLGNPGGIGPENWCRPAIGATGSVAATMQTVRQFGVQIMATPQWMPGIQQVPPMGSISLVVNTGGPNRAYVISMEYAVSSPQMPGAPVSPMGMSSMQMVVVPHRGQQPLYMPWSLSSGNWCNSGAVTGMGSLVTTVAPNLASDVVVRVTAYQVVDGTLGGMIRGSTNMIVISQRQINNANRRLAMFQLNAR